ncbi:unnamed protein product [Protopolystoma xenopodis]|uniref:Uncharacterized protein n=1 Tax=Protopolystoma xenopodis TaxID=117903 RepID=A0A3S4ZU00_9PLAT|nr:unnamed protein product [Protopolystoma xenopodis]
MAQQFYRSLVNGSLCSSPGPLLSFVPLTGPSATNTPSATPSLPSTCPLILPLSFSETEAVTTDGSSESGISDCCPSADTPTSSGATTGTTTGTTDTTSGGGCPHAFNEPELAPSSDQTRGLQMKSERDPDHEDDASVYDHHNHHAYHHYYYHHHHHSHVHGHPHGHSHGHSHLHQHQHAHLHAHQHHPHPVHGHGHAHTHAHAYTHPHPLHAPFGSVDSPTASALLHAHLRSLSFTPLSIEADLNAAAASTASGANLSSRADCQEADNLLSSIEQKQDKEDIVKSKEPEDSHAKLTPVSGPLFMDGAENRVIGQSNNRRVNETRCVSLADTVSSSSCPSRDPNSLTSTATSVLPVRAVLGT